MPCRGAGIHPEVAYSVRVFASRSSCGPTRAGELSGLRIRQNGEEARRHSFCPVNTQKSGEKWDGLSHRQLRQPGQNLEKQPAALEDRFMNLEVFGVELRQPRWVLTKAVESNCFGAPLHEPLDCLR